MADRSSSVYAPEGGVEETRRYPKRRRIGRAVCQVRLSYSHFCGLSALQIRAGA